MTAVFLLCTIILFVLQTLSMKLQHAEHLPQKLLANCAFSQAGRLWPWVPAVWLCRTCSP